MITKSKRKPLAERLKGGLTEAVQFAKGELTHTNRLIRFSTSAWPNSPSVGKIT